MLEEQPEEAQQVICQVCNDDGREGCWYDDDGVIRCDSCHSDVATAWGGDYDELIARRTFTVTQFVMEESDTT